MSTSSMTMPDERKTTTFTVALKQRPTSLTFGVGTPGKLSFQSPLTVGNPFLSETGTPVTPGQKRTMADTLLEVEAA